MIRKLSRRSVLFVILSLLALATSSCGGGNRQIIRQAVPNPFVGATSFFIERPSFDGLLVGNNPNYMPEADYLARRREHAQDAWEADKVAMGERLVASFVAHARGMDFGALPAGAAVTSGFVVHPRITKLSPGSTFSATVVHMIFTITTPTGEVLDEIERSTAVTSTAIENNTSVGSRNHESYSIGGRMRMAGDDLGEMTAGYIRRRVQNR